VSYGWNRLTNGQRDDLVKLPIRTTAEDRKRALAYTDRELVGVEQGLAMVRGGRGTPEGFGLILAVARYEHAGWMPDGCFDRWRRWKLDGPEQMLVHDLVPWLDSVEHDLDRSIGNQKIDDVTKKPVELLVLDGPGLRFGVPGHYGLFEETPTFETAVARARENLAKGHANACVAIRIAAKVIDGIGEGTDRELVRFQVYSDRVALVPKGQGGLLVEQERKVHFLPKKGLL
jgi:hypothetical protein